MLPWSLKTFHVVDEEDLNDSLGRGKGRQALGWVVY